MGRRRGQGQRQVKGFRPGKEPPELRKQRARQQFGDVSGTQQQLIELFAERTPEESRALIRRWTLGLLIGAIVLGVLAAALFAWSAVAGVIVGILALVLLVLWWRLRSQRADLEVMVDAVSGTGGKRRKKK